jgi:mono/diheme cytochrome c family protein
VAIGNALFDGKGTCFACHGKDADTVTGLNPLVHALNPKPTDLRDPRALRFVTDAERFNVLKNGIPGTGMVPMIGTAISEKEAWAVVAGCVPISVEIGFSRPLA